MNKNIFKLFENVMGHSYFKLFLKVLEMSYVVSFIFELFTSNVFKGGIDMAFNYDILIFFGLVAYNIGVHFLVI